ncbi:MAG: alpha/beta hydrolase [Actinomycetota bacterium]
MVDVHPELARAVKRIPKIPITPRSIKINRRVFGSLARVLVRGKRPADGVAIADMSAPGPSGDLALRVYRPLSAPTPTPVIAWIHGGGLIMGTHEDDIQLSKLADATGATVVSPAYRLAPEHPFPAAHDDLLASIEHLTKEPDRFGIDPDRMVVGGQSAGGGLAASMAQLLRDRSIPLRGQLLVYPMLDDRTAVRDDIEATEHPVWNKTSNHTGWGAFLPNPPGAADQPTDSVPARREDLSGLAPAWIGVGTADIFHDEDVAYAERLEAAGVEVTLDVVDGAVHAFELLAPDAEISKAFYESEYEFLRRVLR